MAFEIVINSTAAAQTVKFLEALPSEIKRGIALELRELAKVTARDARSLLRSKRGGGSSPGGPPALRTGALARSIRFKRGRRDGLSYLVSATEFYGRFLETALDRPFITLAVDRRRDQFRDRIVNAIQRAIEGFA